MAKIISSPWIFPTIKELLREVNDNKNTGMMHSNIRPKIVQTINVLAEEKILIVSDQVHFVAVFLTDDCIDDFETNSNNRQLKTLRHSLVKLEKWHVSTTLQCTGNRDMASLMKNHNITLPIAIQCGKITCLEANDSVVIGDPIDINKDADMHAIYSRLTYIELSSRFSERQFPLDRMLPDATGLLCIPRPYSDEYPIRPHHCHVPVGQQLEIDQLKHAMNLLSSQVDDTLQDTQYDSTLIDDGMLDVDLSGNGHNEAYDDLLPPPAHVIDISHRMQRTPPTISFQGTTTPQRAPPAEHTLVDSTQDCSVGLQSPVQWLTQPLNDETLGHMQMWLFTQPVVEDVSPNSSQEPSHSTKEVAFAASVASQDYDITQSITQESISATAPPRNEQLEDSSMIGKVLWKKLSDGKYYRGEVIFYAAPYYTVRYDNDVLEKLKLEDILKNPEQSKSTPQSSKKRPAEKSAQSDSALAAPSTSKAVKFALESIFGTN